MVDLLTYKDSPLLIKENTIKKPKEEMLDIDDVYTMIFDGSYRKSHGGESFGRIVMYDP